MNDDLQLLRTFAEDRSETAFRQLVDLRIDFVYSTALRQVGGDAHLARDITQGVFNDLARKAQKVARYQSLTGWLYTGIRYAAANALRARERRSKRERQAVETTESIEPTAPGDDLLWREVRPLLDAALSEISPRDREALLQRFFEGRTLVEIAEIAGLSENAARMRVDRALAKLRAALARRGIASTAAALAGVLASQPVVAAPAGLAVQVAGASLASLAAAPAAVLTQAFFPAMSTTKTIAIAAGLLGAATLGALWGRQHPATGDTLSAVTRSESSLTGLQEANRRLHTENARLRAAQQSSLEKPAGKADGMSQVTLERLRVLEDLERDKIAHPSITFVDGKGQVTDAFANLFGLTAGERTALQQAVNRARTSLADLESQHATLARDANGNVTVHISPFPEEGGAAYDALMQSFADTLGQDRNAAYLTLGADQVERSLSRFGEPDRTVTFSYDPNKPNDPYVLRDEQKVTVGKSTSTSISNSDFKSYDQMASNAGTVSKLVPSDFHREP